MSSPVVVSPRSAANSRGSSPGPQSPVNDSRNQYQPSQRPLDIESAQSATQIPRNVTKIQSNTPKSGAQPSPKFWSQLSKSGLKKNSFQNDVPTLLTEMFPNADMSELSYVYRGKKRDMNATIEYFIKKSKRETSLFTPVFDNHGSDDEIPDYVLMESLELSLNQTNHSRVANDANSDPNVFESTPKEVLSVIFSFLDPMTLGKLTNVSRECRGLARLRLSNTTVSDFSYFYHRYCAYVGDGCLDHKLILFINAFPHLRCMAIRTQPFSNWHLMASIVTRAHIHDLNLKGCYNLDDESLRTIAALFPAVERLNLSQTGVTDMGMEYLADNVPPRLRVIKLTGLRKVSKFGVRHLLRACQMTLREIYWQSAVCGNSKAFEMGQYLSTIDIYSSRNIVDFNLTMNDPQSEYLSLNLSNCTRLTNVTLALPHLTELNISQCDHLTDLKIESKKLRRLNCAHCPQLQFADIPSKTLKVINLFVCRSLNLDQIMQSDNFLIGSIANGMVQSLDMRSMTQIDDDCVRHIIETAMKAKSDFSDTFDDSNSTYQRTLLSEFSVDHSTSVSKEVQTMVSQMFVIPASKSAERAARRRRFVELRKQSSQLTHGDQDSNFNRKKKRRRRKKSGNFLRNSDDMTVTTTVATTGNDATITNEDTNQNNNESPILQTMD